jgi:hypothetical protein
VKLGRSYLDVHHSPDSLPEEMSTCHRCARAQHSALQGEDDGWSILVVIIMEKLDAKVVDPAWTKGD